MRRGTRLAFDVGSVRVGVARCDPEGLMAVPVVTLPRADALAGARDLITQYEPVEVVVGLPLSLSGGDTASTHDSREFATELAATTPCPVRMVDERLSTVQAQQGLRQAGRATRNSRNVVDQAAAVILLQHTLDAERLQGVPPGFLCDSP
jgi:putative holliday junction resolvase